MKKYTGLEKFENVLRKRLVIEAQGLSNGKTPFQAGVVKKYLSELSDVLGMIIIHGPIVDSFAKKHRPDYYDGIEGHCIWAESGCQFYGWDRFASFTVDIYTCNDFSIPKAVEFTKSFFNCKHIEWKEVKSLLVQHSLELKTFAYGFGVVAKEHITKGTITGRIDGDLYQAESEMLLPEEARNTAIPIGVGTYINPIGGSPFSYLNHSCSPNAYIGNLLEVIALRDIQKDEEVRISYSLICNSDWKNPEGKCLCGSKNCHGKILPWRDLPRDEKIKYLPYAADWILFEEMKKRGYVESLGKDL